ncbi:MAG: hypothetical protein M4D80_40820 [Myxococcota bacterium]|nr:hypothetical protein [Deltaproteobacteria bacterium]MDQ3341537.1 hypothetical protein [Myxococcota bacterium]
MRKQLGQMLIEAGALDEATLRTALADQRRWGRPLGRTLVELRLIREEDLVRVLGQQLGLPSVDIDRVNISKAVTDLVPAELAFRHNIMPFAQPMKFLDVAMLDPTNLGIVDELRIRTQLNIRPYLAGPKMIERALMKYYGAQIGHVEYEIPVEVGPTRKRSQTEERESIAIGADMRDGLKPFPGGGATQHPARARDALLGGAAVAINDRDKEIDALQQRISKLEALVARDEDVLRKLLALLIEKGLATREEILARLN